MKINPMQAAFVRFLSQFHVAAYRLSGGWGPLNRNTLILTTRGRKSGREISKPLLYFEDQGRIYLVASYGGNDSPPAWYLNLSKNPEVKAEVGRSIRNCQARTLTEQEAKPIWPRLLAIYPAYAGYQKKTTRQIPIVELAPA
ncbi:MAG: nitroreductase/quinone reductase family protein [Candidatus Binatales bacterium]